MPQKRDKIFNTLIEKNYSLIIWVNEFTDKKIDSSLFKKICDGWIETTQLYNDGSKEIKLKCKLIGTAILCQIFKPIQDLQGDFMSYKQQSKFVDDLDEAKNFYKKDKFYYKNGDRMNKY